MAAGQGTRLKSLGHEGPKSLVNVSEDIPYLHLNLLLLKKIFGAKVLLVGGFDFEKWEPFLKQYSHEDVDLVRNEDFKKGNLLSLLSAKKHIQEDFLLLNADHLYSPDIYNTMQRVLENPKSLHIFTDRDRQLTNDDMKVHREGGCFVLSKTLEQYDSGYVGVTYNRKDFREAYWSACDDLLAQNGEMTNVEAVVNYISDKQLTSVEESDISGSWWTEIDTEEDYKSAVKTIDGHWGELKAFHHGN